jgi:hypothetical protein
LSVDEEVLGFEVAVDDAPGVAEVDAVDQLEHDESDLLLGYGVAVGGQKFFEVLFGVLEDEVQLLFDGEVDHVHQSRSDSVYLTMLGCGWSSLRMDISRMAVEGTPSSSF